MELNLEFGRAFCYTKIFEINGIKADSQDFGEQYDRDSENAEDYCCGNMQFTRFDEPKEFIFSKYNINIEEYNQICLKLENGLSFGCCGWCS